MKGVEVVKEVLKTVPKVSGVYKMIGANGILYIGKAKNLHNRLKNYTKLEDQTAKNRIMILSILAVEYEVVRTEEEALILESSLIKKHQPPFNILLKDDKTTPYIVLSKSHSFPAIFTYRGKPLGNDEFYGPFGDRTAMESVINAVCKTFKIRTCSDEKFKTAKRPCLEYQIKRCNAPCVGLIGGVEYGADVKLASQFLSGKTSAVVKDLREKMEEASANEDFERAIKLRDQMLGIQVLLASDKIDFKKLENADGVIIKEIGGQIGIEVFIVRAGLSFGARVFFPAKTEGLTLGEVMEFFLMRYYGEAEAPAVIAVNMPVSPDLGRALKCKIINPKKGIFKELLDFASPNLEEKLEKKVGIRAKIKKNLEDLQDLLELSSPINRVEIYDNSHINGSFMLGAMVVAGRDGFIPAEYRKFNAKFEDTKGGDDYAMLKETLKRRFLNEKLAVVKPDLVIIDGGKGQYSSAKEVFEELEIDIPFICMAKGRDRNAGKEWFFYKDREFQLDFTSPLLYYLQNLRDEAHRFAITSHRNRRLKSFI
jgi:excinuclease ABC subunit C